MTPSQLTHRLPTLLGDALISQTTALGEVTCEIAPAHIKTACTALRDQGGFETLVDLCGVDYSTWGVGDADLGGTGSPGGPGVTRETWHGTRFAVIYHLLSVQHNQRLRLRAALDDDNPAIASVMDIWPSANWYEREAFDLFGILFNDHPDLRRLLTDYGFIGHPFRKDFPLSGQVEMRYDEAQGRVIYEPVTLTPRTLVPRTHGKDLFTEDDSGAETPHD